MGSRSIRRMRTVGGNWGLDIIKVQIQISRCTTVCIPILVWKYIACHIPSRNKYTSFAFNLEDLFNVSHKQPHNWLMFQTNNVKQYSLSIIMLLKFFTDKMMLGNINT